MNVEEIRDHCISKQGTEECFPFDEDTLVFKVNGKMYLLLSLTDEPVQFNVKCDPVRALELRDKYDCILPGYHMNKKHWNTVISDSMLTRKQLTELIDHSYELVNKATTKARKEK